VFDRIDQFRGRYFFLSNYSLSSVMFEGDVYPSVEHAFAAARALDPEVRATVRKAGDPDKTKKLVSKGKPRLDWEEVKVDIMRELLRAKFSDLTLAEALLDTGDALLVDCNTWGDTFWGMPGGRGANALGRLLMEVRGEIRAARAVIKGSGPAPSG